MKPWRRRLRRVSGTLWTAFSLVVILAAVLSGIGSLLLPWLVRDPVEVSAWLSARIGRPVTVTAVSAEWRGVGPLLELHGVHLGDGQGGGLPIAEAEFAIDFSAWLSTRRSFSEFRLIGLDIEATRHADGRIEVRGLSKGSKRDESAGASGSNAQDWLFSLGAVTLADSTLRLADVASGAQLAIQADSLRLSNTGSRHRFDGRVHALGVSDPVTVIAEYDTASGTGSLYGLGRRMDLAAWTGGLHAAGATMTAGRADVGLWAWWRDGQLAEARLEFDGKELNIRGSTPLLLEEEEQVDTSVSFASARLAARWRRMSDGWSLDLDDLTLTQAGQGAAPPADLTIQRRNLSGRTEFSLRASRLALDAAAAALPVTDAIPHGVRRWLYLAAPKGAVGDLDLRFRSAEDLDVAGVLHGLTWRSVDKLPGLSPLSASLRGDGQALVLTLPKQALTLEYPHVLREPLAITQASGLLAAYRVDKDWQVEASDLLLGGAGYSFLARAAVRLQEDTSKPFLELYIDVGRAEIAGARRFWPLNAMSIKARTWLDAALSTGHLSSGSVAFRGDADDWPFANHSGRFEAVGQVVGAGLRFHPEWPAAEDLHAKLVFINRSIDIRADRIKLSGNEVSLATATVADTKAPLLQIHADGAGSGATLLGLIKQSPLQRKYGSYLLGLSIGGTGKVALDLQVPLKEGVGEQKISGSVALASSDIHDAKWNLNFDEATGKVRFGDGGFSADELAVGLQGHPASLSIAVGEYTGNPANQAEASLRGSLPAAAVFAGFGHYDTLWPRVRGVSDWTMDLTIERDQDDVPGAKILRVTSDLRGTELALPAPLGKGAESQLPLSLVIGLPALGGSVEARLGGLLRMKARLPGLTQSFAGHVAFGLAEADDIPPSGLRISGDVPALDMSGWMDLSGGPGAMDLVGLDLAAGEILVMGRAFRDTTLRIAPSSSETLITLSGADVQGALNVPKDDLDKRGITARFERLYWSEAKTAQTSGGSDPALLPPLHFWARDLRMGAAQYGEARIETFPSGGGMRIDLVETSAPNLEMRARGDWKLENGRDRSSFDIRFSAENLGRMLDALGYAGIVDGGQTTAQIDAVWDGPPATFALDRLEGKLSLSVGPGRILDVKPGAGRLLGLFSLHEIPRRLSLDFSDLFGKGMSFDSIEGDFRLATGDAFTENLKLKGPAADIGIKGRTGLRQRDYDQEMDVTPKVGGALPVVGALAGGPVGAAAGLVVQGILSGPLDQIARAKYRVTGGWDNPEILLLAKEKRRRDGDGDGDPKPEPEVDAEGG